jgi:hypothetical protein
MENGMCSLESDLLHLSGSPLPWRYQGVPTNVEKWQVKEIVFWALSTLLRHES